MRLRLLPTAALLAATTACEPSAPPGPSNPASDTYAASLEVDIPNMVSRANGDLYYKDVVVGTGTEATVNKLITVTYTGYLTNGTSFDSGEFTDRPLNDSNFIPGWVVGIPGMKVGGKRKVVVGSALGYGAQGSGPIPPNATIVFDIELKGVK